MRVCDRPLETELAPLIGVEICGFRPNGKSNFQGLQAEFHVKAVGKVFQLEKHSGENRFHNGANQVREAFP